MEAKKCIILAPDGLNAALALDLVDNVAHLANVVKLHDLVDVHGPSILNSFLAFGAKNLWVDYKLHDTRDTVAMRVKALVANGAKVITVHASGGVPMMEAAVAAAGDKAEIWAITVLTSLSADEIARIYGRERTPAEIVIEFTLMAKEAGVKTVVCSAQEVGMLASHPEFQGMDFTVPGTRSAGVAAGQQARSGTPGQAIKDGARWLVVASQVVKALDPVAAMQEFSAEVQTALAERT